MIPKIIHYCWFGGKEIPEKDKRCIESWRKYCPDYEIKEWNENNYDITQNKYMEDAYKNKKWGFVPDFARFDIIYKYGGFYLDTDVELIKPLDMLLEEKAYMGFEDKNSINGGIGFGAEAHNPVMKELRDMYYEINFINSDGSLNLIPSPFYISEKLTSMGIELNNEKQVLDWITIFPSDYFCPKDYLTGVLTITANTVSIHHFAASWISNSQKFRGKLLFVLQKIFGDEFGRKISRFIDFPIRAVSKINEIGIKRSCLLFLNRITKDDNENDK